MEILVPLLGVAILFVLVVHQRRTRGARGRVLAEIAAARDEWNFDGSVLRGQVGDATVALRTSKENYDQAWSIEVTSPSPWSRARVEPLADQRGGVRTGHRAFDGLVAVIGGSRETLAALSDQARVAIQRAVDAGFTYDGKTWRYHNVQLTADAQLLQVALALACDLALHVRPVEDVDAVLEERLRREPDPPVRLALLRARLESATPLPDDMLVQLLEPRDWGSVLVARRLQDEAWLFELAEHGRDAETRWEAVEALWGTTTAPRLAAALGRFVEGTEWAGTAIYRLEAVGTVAEVPALRTVADDWLDGNRAAAQQAITAIQARSRGSVGQLSLVEERPHAGALSVAERRRTEGPER